LIRSCCFGVALVILAAFNVAAEEQGITQTSPLRAAVVKVDITPRDSKWLSGYQARQSDGVPTTSITGFSRSRRAAHRCT